MAATVAARSARPGRPRRGVAERIGSSSVLAGEAVIDVLLALGYAALLVGVVLLVIGIVKGRRR